MQDALRKLIEVATENYYSKLSRKFAAKKTNPKCYWPISKIFLITKNSLYSSFNS